MKKILLSAVIALAALFTVTGADAQAFRGSAYNAHNRQSFYYYPRANVYYNVASRQYIYPRNGVWVSVNFLPVNFQIRNTPRFMVYHYGTDVWRDNHTHCVTYSRYRQPVIVYHDPYPYYNKGRDNDNSRNYNR